MILEWYFVSFVITFPDPSCSLLTKHICSPVGSHGVSRVPGIAVCVVRGCCVRAAPVNPACVTALSGAEHEAFRHLHARSPGSSVSTFLAPCSSYALRMGMARAVR